MTKVRSKLDEHTLIALLAEGQRKRKLKAKEERKPRPSLWAAGVSYGKSVIEERPATISSELQRAKGFIERGPRYDLTENAAKADAYYQHVSMYYRGAIFALTGSKLQADFFAKGAPKLQELVAAS